MINVCFINGSPRKRNSGSSYLISELTKLLDNNVKTKEYFISNLMKSKNSFIYSYKAKSAKTLWPPHSLFSN